VSLPEIFGDPNKEKPDGCQGQVIRFGEVAVLDTCVFIDKFWVSMEHHEWVSMEHHEWVSMEHHEWVSMEHHESVRGQYRCSTSW